MVFLQQGKVFVRQVRSRPPSRWAPGFISDERQLVLYGPPGTGKTHLAMKLAEYFGGGPEQAKIVQFHPSYFYEDFFEGFPL